MTVGMDGVHNTAVWLGGTLTSPRLRWAWGARSQSLASKCGFETGGGGEQ